MLLYICNQGREVIKMINKNIFENTSFNACHILGILKDTVNDYAGSCNTLEELAEHAYNEDYAYIYYKDAKEALQTAGVFDCFQVVHDYMLDMEGEDDINYYNPVDVANVLLYIQGDKIIQAVANWLGIDIDDDLTKEQWNKLSVVSVKNLIPFLNDFHSFKEHL